MIRIWCTGHDDPIKYSEFVTRHGFTDAPDAGTSIIAAIVFHTTAAL